MISTRLLAWMDWNPQLWQKVKSHFKKRSVMSIVSGSVLNQILLLQFFRRALRQAELNYSPRKAR